MAACAVKGGCPSDYVAVSVALLSFILLLAKAVSPYLIHNIPRPKGSSFWLVAIQVFASFNLLLSIVMALGLLRLRRKPLWNSCYIWAVWVEGPLGFGLLLSCRIVQVFQLYNIFVKRRLPPIRAHIFLPLVIFPWVAAAAFLHLKKPLNGRCHMKTQWFVPFLCLHGFYIATLLGFTGALQHIEFRFHELKDLWRGILVSFVSIGIWVVAYVLNEIHEDISLVQIISRSVLLISTSVLVLAFFSISLSQPLISLLSLTKKKNHESKSMSQALGIPDSGILLQRDSVQSVDPNQPLDKLLLEKRFRQSFMEFADSCLAGESVHFYEEVLQLEKVPTNDVRRIYMARHIIDKYIIPGSTMEVNISHHCRQGILTTPDLTHPDLFKNALHELIQLMKMNLLNDYWSSTFFIKLKEENKMKTVSHELDQMGTWNFSHRMSSVHCNDDPFHHVHSPRKPCSSIQQFELK